MFRRSRSSKTGRFVDKAAVAADPAGTVTETVTGTPPWIGYVQALCLALSVEGDLDRISREAREAYYLVMEHMPR